VTRTASHELATYVTEALEAVQPAGVAAAALLRSPGHGPYLPAPTIDPRV
jgi:hypothetical protein